MVLDDALSPIRQMPDFLSAKRLIRLSIRWWIPRHSNDINVNEVQFPGQRGDSGGQCQGPAPEEYQEAGTDVDLPF